MPLAKRQYLRAVFLHLSSAAENGKPMLRIPRLFDTFRPLPQLLSPHQTNLLDSKRMQHQASAVVAREQGTIPA